MRDQKVRRRLLCEKEGGKKVLTIGFGMKPKKSIFSSVRLDCSSTQPTLLTYSPQLNLIETLWRFMKYEWIKKEAYSSWKNLVEYVEKILKDFDTEYTINWA